jgi:hypothetical protein
MVWITVVAYWATAVLLGFYALCTKGSRLWWGLALGMLVLGINKQQDTIGLLTSLGRGEFGLPAGI